MIRTCERLIWLQDGGYVVSGEHWMVAVLAHFIVVSLCVSQLMARDVAVTALKFQWLEAAEVYFWDVLCWLKSAVALHHVTPVWAPGWRNSPVAGMCSHCGRGEREGTLLGPLPWLWTGSVSLSAFNWPKGVLWPSLMSVGQAFCSFYERHCSHTARGRTV